MSVQENPALPSATELLNRSLHTAKIRLLPGRHLPPYPVPLRCGLPVAKGKLNQRLAAWLISPDGAVLPAQMELLSTWPDGSARWVLIEALLPVTGSTPIDLICVCCDPPRTSETPPPDWAESIAKFGLDGLNMPALVDADGKVLTPILRRRIHHPAGPIAWVRRAQCEFPLQNSLRMEIRQSGWTGSFSPHALMAMDVTLHNSSRARHPGGLWDLGDAGSFFFRQFAWTMGLTLAGIQRLEYQLQPGDAWTDSLPEVHIHQESSGGEAWNSINHINQTGTVPWRYRGYSMQTAAGQNTGLRATPSLRVISDRGCLTVTICDFWQRFPTALRAVVRSDSANEITLGFLPEREGRAYELQGGERFTQTCWLKFDPAGSNEDLSDLSWVHDPPRLVPVLEDQPLVPGWPRLNGLDETPISRLNSLSDEVLDGPASVFARREQIDEYGWRNFGDFFADHETRYFQGPPPLISHFNNQYDALGGLLLQGVRTEDRRWFELAENLARHVTEIDLYHTTEDRAVFNGGLFWLTDHYSSCGTATHRCFSKLNAKPGQPYGGGPGCEHNYSTGLLAYFWLTGNPAAKDAVIQLAEWVLAMDDGRQTIFGLFDDGPTGAATATAEENYHGPGRGAGNSINSLLDAWLLTGDRKYLTNAETFLQRCIHPQDDVAARDLLNFELRWSYTVFLMAVFKYLECKRELDEIDANYEYARQSLLNYAAWMAEHERPYFDCEEQMEFPTETWGAQELRKANVFRWAARYADEPLRSRLQSKGNEFAERAWHDLCRFPSRTFIRPFTLAMIQGLWDAVLRSPAADRPDSAAPAVWQPPSEFVPQKTRIRRLLKSPRGWITALMRAGNPQRWGRFWDAVRRMM